MPIHSTPLTIMASPPLQQCWCTHDKDSLSPPWPSELELGCYLMWLWLHCVIMLFLLKENTSTTGLCEFWHTGCLPGNVPLHFWVCSKRPSGFGDVSCWFSVILSHVISVRFPREADLFVKSEKSNLVLSMVWFVWWV